MENGNKKLLWLMVIVNVLTLVLLIVFVVMSWDVITTEKTSQEIKQQTPTSISTQQQVPQAQQQAPQGQQQSPTGGQKLPIGGQMQPPTDGTIKGKCGDGICDEKEKANPNLCPQDCK